MSIPCDPEDLAERHHAELEGKSDAFLHRYWKAMHAKEQVFKNGINPAELHFSGLKNSYYERTMKHALP